MDTFKLLAKLPYIFSQIKMFNMRNKDNQEQRNKLTSIKKSLIKGPLGRNNILRQFYSNISTRKPTVLRISKYPMPTLYAETS